MEMNLAFSAASRPLDAGEKVIGEIIAYMERCQILAASAEIISQFSFIKFDAFHQISRRHRVETLERKQCGFGRKQGSSC